MNLVDRIGSALVLLACTALCAPRAAYAQIDDPGLEQPPPKKDTPPAKKDTPPPAKKDTPPPRAFTPPPPLPPPGDAPVKEEVKEEVSTSPTATLSDDQWEAQLAAPALLGSVGLLRMHTAEVGLPLNFRVSSHMQGFEAKSFLVAGSGGSNGDDNSRFLGDLTIGLTLPDVVFLRNLELYLGLYNSSNQNTRTDPGRTDPSVILGLGDVGVGVKGAWRVFGGLSIGAHIGVRFFNKISGELALFDATTPSFDLIASLDVRKWAPKVPVRFHLNFGFLLDNSDKLLPAGQCAQSTGNDPCIRSRVVETFAYGLGAERLRFALALDLPFRPHVPWGIFGVEPFIEYHLDSSVGDGDTVIATALGKDTSIASDRINNRNQQYLTGGIRFRPVARFVLDLGVDIGLQSPGFAYGPPVPPWNIILGAAYTYDPGGSTTKVIKRTITRTIEANRAPPEGHLRGLVRDAKTKKPVAGAIVRYAGRGNLSPQATDEQGAFFSYGLPPGIVTIDVSRGEDYEPASVSTNVELGVELPLDVTLKPKPPRDAKITIKLADDKGGAILGAVAKLVGPVTKEAQAEGESLSARVPGGEYTVSVDAPGFLARDKQITVVAATDQLVDLQLRKRPPESHVSITKDQIVIKGTIHFGTNNAIILPDGQQLLDEVVDVLAKNGQIRRVSIEGHTDNRGPAERNLKLSKDRAAAVLDYLVKQGISGDRLGSEGFGATKPLVPNLTPANRAKNRRVEFRITDQGGGAFPQ